MAATLETYRSKRDFKTTPEPAGRKPARAKTKPGFSYVIQKHDATRLHYDFRLEMDGVLKSWAVTRGPSLDPSEKRLAVHVEDHPLEYGGFEGTIPKGEYGGGTVLLWDRGSWEPVGDPHKGYAKGHLEFELKGEKLHGRWHLVKMHGKPREKRENWLLIKAEDEEARPAGAPDILDEMPDSVTTGRAIADVENEAPGWSSKTGKIEKSARKKAASRAAKAEETPEPPPPLPDPATLPGAKKARMLNFVEPALATLADTPPAGARWIHEIKFDGYRLQAHVAAGRVKLLTRTGLDWTKKFGKEIVAALQALPLGTALIDGELVVETASGASDFSALQADLSEGRSDRFIFYAFDLIYLDGYDLRELPLSERKQVLAQVVADGAPLLRLSQHFEEDGAVVFHHAQRLGLEGIVSKVLDSPYRSGRSKTWLKTKSSQRQEFVIGGYVPSTTSRRAIGSLVLGVHENGTLQPVGRVGTGFSSRMAEDLFQTLERMRVTTSPFGRPLTAEEGRQVRFVRPELVAEIEYRAWTADGHLRHAAFRGLREDKPADEITREMPTMSETGKAKGKVAAKAKDAAEAESHGIKLTHPDRIYWPDAGVTKEGLADYYAEIWPHIAPFVTDRPLSLLRCPSGINGEQFFQKNAWKGLNAAIRLVDDPSTAAVEQLISIADLDGLIALVQSAVLEIHPWGSTVADWERPDMIIMDLDPGEGVDWETVITAAGEVRQRLSDAGLEPFVKTSGGKGLHVVAPLTPKAEWPAVKAFTKGLADAMAGDSPDHYVATITKAKRPGKILIDYLRNQRGQTAVAPYSTRARPGAPVSAPLAWEELTPGIGPSYFTVLNMPTRLAALARDPWADFRKAAAPLREPKQPAKKQPAKA
ncbi:ATP-dependent DNA ligase [Kaistia sp. 32K]|uniref:DNA ligase D n=1 Tax=Kaistia sp. 32K TaxID=2795690 RepID=UPI001915F920|nr:DNA ligase D [Kaistia sp. 32K]BCP51558.1 ATP-dependent DNA ligase [Kaistia sp. 32K]